jgi:hypothetical protein
MKQGLTVLVAVLASLHFGVLSAPAAEQATVERESRLHAEPRLDAPEVAVATPGTVAEVLGKSGAWLNVRTPSATGWLFSFNVRFIVKPADTAQESASGGDSAIGRVFGPRRGVNVTSTIGVRGLEKEDLRQAQFSAEQMQQLDGFAASREAAQESARAKGLTAVQVDYLQAGTQ